MPALVVAVLALPPAVAGAAPGPVGTWGFDEPGGQHALDAGPFGLDGRLGRSEASDELDPARIAGARGGGALRFGGGTFVRLPDASELAPAHLTVEAVVRAEGSPGRWRSSSPAAPRTAWPAPTASTPARPAAWPSTSSTGTATSSARRPASRTSGTGAGTTSPASSTAVRPTPRGRPPRRRPDGRAPGDRLRADLEHDLPRDLRGHLRAALPGRRRPRAPVVLAARRRPPGWPRARGPRDDAARAVPGACPRRSRRPGRARRSPHRPRAPRAPAVPCAPRPARPRARAA